MWKGTPSQWIEEMTAFYSFLQDGTSTRETGVFIDPHFAGPGTAGNNDGQGQYWLQTIEQTYLHLDIGGLADFTTQPAHIEILYDYLAVAGELAPELEGI